jgi:hypothetical protein
MPNLSKQYQRVSPPNKFGQIQSLVMFVQRQKLQVFVEVTNSLVWNVIEVQIFALFKHFRSHLDEQKMPNIL